MAQRKKEIDFIAAQKLMGKSGQTTSFEFILVVSVVVVAAAVVGWYFLAKGQRDDAVEAQEAVQTRIDEAKQKKTRQDKKFNQYLKVPTGQKVFNAETGVLEDVYTYRSINSVEAEIRAEVEAARNIANTTKGAVDLTSSVIDMSMLGAVKYGCQVTSFAYASTIVTLTVTGPDSEARDSFVEYLEGSDGAVFGFNPSQYINTVTVGSTTESEAGISFSVSFTVFSDMLNSNI